MVVLDKVDKAKTLTLKQLSEENPEYINYITEAIGLLITENDLLRKIASRYSHDLRSPVTNIDMLLQLYVHLHLQKTSLRLVQFQQLVLPDNQLHLGMGMNMLNYHQSY